MVSNTQISKQAQCKNSEDRSGDPKKIFSALFPLTFPFLDTSAWAYTGRVFRFGSSAKIAKQEARPHVFLLRKIGTKNPPSCEGV